MTAMSTVSHISYIKSLREGQRSEIHKRIVRVSRESFHNTLKGEYLVAPLLSVNVSLVYIIQAFSLTVFTSVVQCELVNHVKILLI